MTFQYCITWCYKYRTRTGEVGHTRAKTKWVRGHNADRAKAKILKQHPGAIILSCE